MPIRHNLNVCRHMYTVHNTQLQQYKQWYKNGLQATRKCTTEQKDFACIAHESAPLFLQVSAKLCRPHVRFPMYHQRWIDTLISKITYITQRNQKQGAYYIPFAFGERSFFNATRTYGGAKLYTLSLCHKYSKSTSMIMKVFDNL